MNRNCLLCGVGGQGVVLASRLIAYAAMEQGDFVRTTETIGKLCEIMQCQPGDLMEYRSEPKDS